MIVRLVISSIFISSLLTFLPGNGSIAKDQGKNFSATKNESNALNEGFPSVDSGFAVSTPSVIEPSSEESTPVSSKQNWPDPKPIFLALDGISFLATVTPKKKFERKSGYLGMELKERWGDVTDIHSVTWGGDLKDNKQLSVYLFETKKEICRIRFANTGRPFVIIGHSWGSVVGHKALLELEREPCIPGGAVLEKGAIDLFITIGSPLGKSINNVCRPIANTLLSQELSGTPSKPSTVSIWTNIEIQTDLCSSKIHAADYNLPPWRAGWKGEITPAPYPYFVAHEAYYTKPTLAKKLAEVITGPHYSGGGYGGGGGGSWGGSRGADSAKSTTGIDTVVSGTTRLPIKTEVRVKGQCNQPDQIGIFNSVAGLVFFPTGVLFVTADDNSIEPPYSYKVMLNSMNASCKQLLPQHYAMFGEAIALFEASDRILTICENVSGKKCIDSIFAFADVTGDGQLTTAEVARVGRGLAFYLSNGVAYSSSPGKPVPYENIYAGTAALGLLGPVFAKGLIASVDFDGNDAASLDELLQDRGPNSLTGGVGTIASASTQVALKGIFTAIAKSLTLIPALVR